MATQLQVLSSKTLLHSTIRIPDLVKNALKNGYKSLALTDVNVTYNLVDFYKAAKAAGLKAILGMTVQVKGLLESDQVFPLIVLAKNDFGYHNLLKLSSKIMTSDEDISMLENKALLNNLIVIMPGESSELNYAISQGPDFIKQLLQNIKDLNLDEFYLGISLRGTANKFAKSITRIAQLNNFQTVALDDIRYLNSNDAFATNVLQHIETGEKISDYTESGPYYLRSANNFKLEFEREGLLDALKNTDKIAKECNVNIEFKRTQLPSFKTPNDISSIIYLKKLVYQGLKLLFLKNIPNEYIERAGHELKVIEKMGFADYFLIVWDAVNQAHKMNIFTGPGRGSAAGSLVSYALGITRVDPIEYGLLFERFLNPERVDMPDIDLDIPDTRRDDLVHYMQKKYGSNNMSQIITFGTFAAKQSLRDVGRVFGQSQIEMSRWSKAIPKKLGIDLKTSYKQSLPLRNLYQQSSRNQLIFKTALKIEGLPRHFSTHAAGVVLSKEPLDETVAVQNGGSADTILTQQTKSNVEALGLLKIDFLGLRNLTILDNAIKIIKNNYNSKFNAAIVPMNDAKTLRLFQLGDTDGVFQFESAGIKSVLRRLKPTSFEDVVATNALYRPGPMENIPTFIARKHGQEPIVYPDESLRPILKSTYGVLVYQEQVMQSVSNMAGFSLAEADILRRAMAKKKKSIIDEKRTKFIEESIKRGHKKENAVKVYDYIERFSNYGFNKSHAVAYSKLAYTLAYIKTWYPQAFFTAVINSNVGNDEKIQVYLQSLKTRKIPVKAPDINLSQRNFTTEEKAIRFGLLFIKGTRRDFISNILEERKNGKYTSLLNFLQRIDQRFLKLENIEPFIYSGAFDSFNKNRHEMELNAKDLVERISLAGESLSLFDVLKPKDNYVDDYSEVERLDKEKKYLGVYVSGHPVDKYKYLRLDYPIKNLSLLEQNQISYVLYFLRNIKVIRTKRGEQMAFVDGGDATRDYPVTIFPSLYRKLNDLEASQVYLMRVKPSLNRRGDTELIAQSIQKAKNIKSTKTKHQLFIRLSSHDKNVTNNMMKILNQYHGNVPVLVYFSDTDSKYLLKKANWIDYNDKIKAKLVKLVGPENIVFE